jgi:hypothetical protein
MLFTIALFAAVTHAFDCALTASSISYDLTSLSGLHTASITTETPPTSNEAKVYFNLCGNIGDDEAEDQDKVGNVSVLLTPVS